MRPTPGTPLSAAPGCLQSSNLLWTFTDRRAGHIASTPRFEPNRPPLRGLGRERRRLSSIRRRATALFVLPAQRREARLGRNSEVAAGVAREHAVDIRDARL